MFRFFLLAVHLKPMPGSLVSNKKKTGEKTLPLFFLNERKAYVGIFCLFFNVTNPGQVQVWNPNLSMSAITTNFSCVGVQ
jgi:hypothetical protein